MHGLKKIYIVVFFLGTLFVSQAIPVSIFGKVLTDHVSQVFSFYSTSFYQTRDTFAKGVERFSELSSKQTAQVLSAVDTSQKNLWTRMIDVFSDPLVPLFTPQVIQINPVEEKKRSQPDPQPKEVIQKVILEEKPKEKVVVKTIEKIPNKNVIQNYYYGVSQSQLEKAISNQVALNQKQLLDLENRIREYVSSSVNRQADSISNSLNRANVVTVVTQQPVAVSSATFDFSETVTGLDYAGGVLSVTSGYDIPLSASSTEWSSFFATPSSRITAGTGLSWVGNTLNATGGSSATTTINGVNGPTFTIASGTTGTDFNIATSSGTLTLNIPSASALNRGLLTAADFSRIPSSASSTEWSNKVSSQWENSSSNIYYATGTVAVGGAPDPTLYGRFQIFGTGTSATTSPTLLIKHRDDTSGSKNAGIFTQTRMSSRYLQTVQNIGQNDNSFGNPGVIQWTAWEYSDNDFSSLATPTEFTGWSYQYYNGSGYQNLLRIHTSGVGIGMATPLVQPAAKLHVISSNSDQLRLGYDTSNYWTSVTGSNGATVFNATGSGALFSFADNVGIATTTPNYSLTVAGDVSITGALRASGNAGTSGYLLQSTGTGLQWVATSSLGMATSSGGGSGTINSGTAGQFAFYQTTGTAVSGTSTLFLSNGNIGVGTTTPGAKLTVAGHTQTNSLSILGGGTYEAGSIYSDANWGMLFRARQNSPSGAIFRWADASDTEQFRISTTGNMLVGTTTNTSKLSVSGGGYFYGDLSSEGSNQTRVNVTTNGNVSTALAAVKIANNGSGAILENLSYGSSNTGSTWFGLGSNNAVFNLAYGGSLAGYGIGTLTSASLILGTNNAMRIQIDGFGNVNTDSGTMYVDATHNTVGIGGTRSGAVSSTNPRLRITASTSSSLGSAFEIVNSSSGSRLMFRDDGRLWLGDGIASYGEHLSVTTSGTQTGLVLQTSGTGYTSGDGFRLQSQDATGIRYLNYESTPHVFYIASNEVARFSSTGAVMQITGTLAAQYSGAGSSRGGAISLISSVGTPQDWIMATAGNDNTIVNGRSWFLYDNTNSVARFFVDTNGNIGAGLGTATATARLHVRGTADPSFRGDYDASNYWTARTSSTGVTTFDAVGTLPRFVLSDDTLVGTTTAVGKLTVSNNGGGTGIYAEAYRSDTDVYGGYFKSNLISSTGGYYSYGIYAEALADFDSNGSYGVYGKVSGNFATAGVYGVAGNYGAGVKGTANSADTQALLGEQSNASGYALYTSGGKNYIQNNLGIGTTTPGQKLVVVGNAQITAVTSGTYSSDLNLTSDGTLTTSASDIRLKENMLELSSDTLDKLGNIKAYTFNWKNDPEQRLDVGLIAQEVETVFPELVFTNKTDGFKGVNYSRLSVLLLKGFQEQQKLLGTTTTSLSAETTQAIIQEALAEANRNPVTVIVDRTTGGVKTLTNFVAVRVTAVRGYFSELFTKEIITEKLCVTKTDGTKVCVNGDQLDNLLQNAGMNTTNTGSNQTTSSGGGSVEPSSGEGSDTGATDTTEGQATGGGGTGESGANTDETSQDAGTEEGVTGSNDTTASSDTGSADSSVSSGGSDASADTGGGVSGGDASGSGSAPSSGGDAGGSAGSSTGGGDSGGSSSGSGGGGESSGGSSVE